MYSTCLYCTKDLGANEVLETLPVGRRVAFDERQGRLWVVCRGCEKWNLVPFETRLETIDTCERLFSDTRVRFSTDNIGIARVKEGLELVRIGPAQRPEFASWRYGDQFGRRRLRHALAITASVVAGVAMVTAGRTILPILAGTGFGANQILTCGGVAYSRRRVAVRIPERDGVGGVMTAIEVQKAAIVGLDADNWLLRLKLHPSARHGFVGLRSQVVELQGPNAVEALGHLLPKINHNGGSQKKVRDAVTLVDDFRTVDALVDTHRHTNFSATDQLRWLDVRVRLAIEMVAHEDTERTALAGELKFLEREWKAADELAKIADSLAVSDDVDRQRPEGRE